MLINISAFAKLEVKQPCSNGMVLQQKSESMVWGHATAGATVKVTPSWDGKSYSAKTGKDGIWRVKVSTPAASYSKYEISVNGDGGSMVISDVLVGEVWIASGQSNMEMPIRGFYNCPVEGAAEVIASAPVPDKIRMFTAELAQSMELENDVNGMWRKAVPDEVAEMSATAYFFAKKLSDMLDVPIGIMAFPYGGSHVESWLPREILKDYADVDITKEGIDNTNRWDRPLVMYNAMEWPLRGYTAKGFIWYQGCSNVGQHDRFVERFSKAVAEFRRLWADDNAEMPFYTVEIAGYRYGGDGFDGARLRQAQHDAVKVIPNSGIVVTNDLNYDYELDQIHPCRKQEVGNRLAYYALNRNYGYSRIACESPVADKILKENDNEIIVHFTQCGNGIDRTKGVEGLEICGEDGIYHPVSEVVFEYGTDYLRITSEAVAKPCGVRYGWGDFKPGNLHNCEGLPVSPFELNL